MIEDLDSNSRELDLHFYSPREHVSIMLENNPGEDLSEYFKGYSLEMTRDALNSFYGGTVKFDEEENIFYDKEKSKKYEERVEDRLGWLVEFKYTPKEIKEKTEVFLEDFKERELNSGEEWTEVVNRWREDVMPLASTTPKGEE